MLRRTVAAVNSPAVSSALMRAVEREILNDHMVSSVHDVKATVLAPFAFRFKVRVCACVCVCLLRCVRAF